MSSFGFCYRLGYPVPFVLDTSPKSIDREGLGESRAGTRQPIIGTLEKLEFRCVSSPLQGAYNYPMSRLSRRFHRPIYFSFLFSSNSDPHRNLSEQLQSQARTNVDMST